MKTRIAKFIADTGVASRRGAELLIASGRVTVNGAVVTTPVFFVEDADTVKIDGAPISVRTETELYMFHKPIDTVTTAYDPRGRKTIYDCLPKKYKNLKYVGRLDYKTTGLLLMTNDGALARKLTLPSTNIARTYIANTAATDLSGLRAARRGMTIDGITYRPMKIDDMGNGNLRVTVTEGKKNEIRIVLRACGAPVRRLHRISYGPIELGNLPPEKIIPVPQKTIDAMIKSF